MIPPKITHNCLQSTLRWPDLQVGKTERKTTQYVYGKIDSVTTTQYVYGTTDSVTTQYVYSTTDGVTTQYVYGTTDSVTTQPVRVEYNGQRD